MYVNANLNSSHLLLPVSVFYIYVYISSPILFHTFYLSLPLFLDYSYFFKVVFIYFIYLFLAVLGLWCCAQALSSCGEWVLFFVATRGLLMVVA